MMQRICYIVIAVILSCTAMAQQRSAKRGVGWDEKKLRLTDGLVDQMSTGISWLYNWGLTPQGSVSNMGPGQAMEFVPMCWNSGFNEGTLRSYLTSHPGVKYLLGFNEPNFSSQSNMTPQQAVDKWPRLEQIAADHHLLLVAPALNFSGEKVGGRTWTPYEWYDEFFRLYPTARVDYLALHCYMNWYSATMWFATAYFYKDLYDSSKTDVYGRYPNLKAYLDNYKAANGHFPRMFLTEFCAWENDGTIKNVDFQIDQMTQKVQKLEQSDLVAGYAWFIGNNSSGATAYPYMSIFQSNSVTSALSDLGKVYVYMSSFDTEKYYAPGELVMAKDYVDATTDNQQVRLRPNTETGSDVPLQVELQGGSIVHYQVNVPVEGEYVLTLHMRSQADATFRVYLGQTGYSNMKLNTTIPSTSSQWKDCEVHLNLPAGNHRMLIQNGSSQSFLLNTLMLTSVSSAIMEMTTITGTDTVWYSLDGQQLQGKPTQRGVYVVNGHKVMIR